jgi:carbamoyltransferase
MSARTAILGVSAFYHDSAAALLVDGDIVAAAQEERFSRKKFDARFPRGAIAYCLRAAGVSLRDLRHVVFYDKPLLKFDRLLETYLGCAPIGLKSFLAAMPIWLRDKLHLKARIRRELADTGGCPESELPPLLFTEHHQAHAASAFYPSPFPRAAVLCLDGVGEWSTTSVWLGEENRLTPKWEIDFPHSLGLLYSAFTYYTGFKVNSGEYKLMGLAPYGEPKFSDLILRELIDLKADGTFRLNMRYFDFATGLTMTNHRFAELFGAPARTPESEITRHHADVAASIQKVTEEVMMRLARTAYRELGCDYLCLAGGVALNCVANGKILREGPYKDIWVQPAAGDAGGAVGAALAAWHQYHRQPRAVREGDAMKGAYLGPEFSDEEIREALDLVGARYTLLSEDELVERTADLLARERVVGWFQGRMEFGPRALGARSILGDPRSPRMQSVMNLKIKQRESFRPFAPAVLAEEVSRYFELDRPSPYMLLVAPVAQAYRRTPEGADERLFGIDKLKLVRSEIPAVTHVDYSARVQTVHRETNPRFHAVLQSFRAKTGCAVLVNTSFNVRGEPIVCTPRDAYRCFMGTEMDNLAIGNLLLSKEDQPVRDRSMWELRERELD